MYRLETIH